MKTFTSTLLALLATTITSTTANSVTFISHDDITRTIIFTADAGLADIPTTTVAGHGTARVAFPHGWIGNWYAVQPGQPAGIPGMLGEVTFNGWNDYTYFDVSAIVEPNDKDNVKEMWPLGDETPTSGCKVFPCDNAYYLWDDVQTKVTTLKDLVCTLGVNGAYNKRDMELELDMIPPRDDGEDAVVEEREVAVEMAAVERKYVMGKM